MNPQSPMHNGGATGQHASNRSFLEECWALATPAAAGRHGAAGQQTSECPALLPCDPVLPQPSRGSKTPAGVVENADIGLLPCDPAESSCTNQTQDGDTLSERIARIAPDDLPGDWRAEWEERAAIMEYDGGLHRERAEALALFDIIGQMWRSGAHPARHT